MSFIKSVAFLVLALTASAAGASGFSSLEERMSQQEFDAAGLDKLSPDELARLNDWLRSHWPAQAVAPFPANADTQRLSGVAAPRDAIVSRLVGEFTGWDSRSVFHLENGMVWEGTGDTVSRLQTPKLENPTVIIEPASFGTWLLRIEGYNATLRVRQARLTHSVP